MNLLKFNTLFPDEASCRAKWKAYRDKQGVICPHCGCKAHYWKQDKENYECKSCGYRQSLRANTIMHGSQLPFRYWFIAIHWQSSPKNRFSSNELQHLLGYKRHEPIWAMLRKLRHAMKERDVRYQLSEVVEFFSTDALKSENGKA